MKESIKKVFSVIWSWLLPICVTLLLISAYEGCQSKREIGRLNDQLLLEKSETVRWKDEHDREHVVAQVLRVDLNYLRESKDSEIVRLREEVKNTKNLLAYMRAELETRGEVRAPVVISRDPVDSLKTVRNFDYEDEWLDMTGSVSEDSAKVQYGIRNDISFTYKWETERSGFLGLKRKKVLKGELISNNPNTTANKVIPIIVEPPRKKWYETRGAAFGAGILAVFAGIALLK